jgi:hypothetical protein
MPLLITVNKTHICNVAFINVITKVFTSSVLVPLNWPNNHHTRLNIHTLWRAYMAHENSVGEYTRNKNIPHYKTLPINYVQKMDRWQVLLCHYQPLSFNLTNTLAYCRVCSLRICNVS